MTHPRLRRLKKDYQRMLELAEESSLVSIEKTEGSPPKKYVLRLFCKGITHLEDGQPLYSESHLLSIHLHQRYPSWGPLFSMLTPVVHPNIAVNGLICIGDEGDHGYAPSMPLDDLVIRVLQMIRYQNVGLVSAFNVLAAAWARKNQELFPLDTTPIFSGDPLANWGSDEIVIVDDEDNSDLDITIW